jgi:ribosomal protein L18E
MPMLRQEKKEDLVIIPGSVIWEQQKLKPKKVVIEITFTNDSTYNYKVTTSR